MLDVGFDCRLVDVRCWSVGIVNGVGGVSGRIGVMVGVAMMTANWVGVGVKVDGGASTAVDGWLKGCRGGS
jgi:hypothetical protein